MPSKFEADPEPIFHMAFSQKINQKKMKKLEKEYTTMKTKEKEDEIELRVSVCLNYLNLSNPYICFLFYSVCAQRTAFSGSELTCSSRSRPTWLTG